MSLPLFVTDLDGTLLQTDGRLSPRALGALTRLVDEGVPISVASGRAFSSIRQALGKLTLRLPIISSDGALISAYDDPRPLHLFSMDEDPLERLIADLVDRGHAPWVDLWDGAENLMLSTGPTNPIEAWFHDHKVDETHYRWRHDPALTRPTGSKTISLTLLDRPEWLEPLKDELDETWGDWFKTDYMVLRNVEDGAALWIQHRDARKEAALEHLGRHLGYEGDRIVVFGDELNDLGMFGREWHAVAVANAREEVKGRAREVIGPHHEDAVVDYIERRVAALKTSSS